MKLLSNLESLDNIKDGGNRKLNIMKIIECTSVSPFIFNDNDIGYYSLKGDYDTHYFKGSDSDNDTVNLYADTLYVIKDYTSASNNDVIGYVESSRLISTSLIRYTIEVVKDTTDSSGISLGTSTTNTFAEGIDISGQDQTISGVKTFSSLPVSSGTPTNNNQLVNKSYVDASSVHYVDLSLYISSSTPYIFGDIKPGLYLNVGSYSRSTVYFKLNSECTDCYTMSNCNIPYFIVDENPSGASTGTPFARVMINNYITNSSTTNYSKYEVREYCYTFKVADITLHPAGITATNVNSTTYQPPNKVLTAYSYSTASSASKTAYTDATIQVDSYFLMTTSGANTKASALTLKVNSGTAKPIYINGEPSSATNYTMPKGSFLVYYDGTNYYLNNDGTIPKLISSKNSSIQNIVEISYADYQDLVANNTVDPKTEYHIVDSDTTYTQDLVSLKSLPLGAIIEYPATTNLPEGYLICDGSAISRTAYADLFAIIGTTFGAGDGSTTFNLPNKKGRVTVGIDPNDTTFDTIGETGGSKYLQAHSHTQAGYPISESYTWAAPNQRVAYVYTETNPYPANVGTSSSGSGDSGNLQPFIVSNYIIKVSETTALVAQVVDNLNSNSTTNAPSIHAVKEVLNNKARATVDFYSMTNRTTSSTTDVDISNANTTITTYGGDLLITTTISAKVTNNMGFISLYIDNTLIEEVLCLNATVDFQSITANSIVTGLSAGSHTIKLKMHVQNSNNVLTINNYNTNKFTIVEL